MAYEIPNGTVDGTNPTFTTNEAIYNEQLFVDRVVQISGTDYTVTSNTITFLPGAIPQPGAVIQIWYAELPSQANDGAAGTVAQLIEGAFRLLGVLPAGEAPEASEQADAFDALNDMLDSWSNERLALFATVRSAYALTPNLNPHTIGTEGSPTFSATRPIRIDRASIVLASSSNAELPLTIVDDAGWQITQGKTTAGIPVYLWPETAYPLVNLWLNPIPVNADKLILYTWQQLGNFTSVYDSVDYPPGYRRALRYNLAKELAPEYGVTLAPEAADIAEKSLSALKRANTKPVYVRSDPATLRRGPFNIISGDRG